CRCHGGGVAGGRRFQQGGTQRVSRRRNDARHHGELRRADVGGPRRHAQRAAPWAKHRDVALVAAATARPGPRWLDAVHGAMTVASALVAVLFATHPCYLDHVAGHGHPERPARLDAVLAGAQHHDVADALVPLEPRAASREELERVHPAAYLDAIERFCRAGGGRIDADTAANSASWDAAVLAAGAGLACADALNRGEAEAAFCAVRPPGHHATGTRAMGFCLINNIAVTAAAL